MATMSARDPRTGTVRAPAGWSIFIAAERAVKRFPSDRRVLFYCDGCLRDLVAASAKRLAGIDPPDGASEFWRGSITEHVRQAGMEMRRQERAARPPAASTVEPHRWRDYNPQQLAQARFVRRMLRGGEK